MGKGSILIVDDEYGVRSGIRTILEMEGYEVGEAGDGAGALAPWTSATTTSPCSTTVCPTPTASACCRR